MYLSNHAKIRMEQRGFRTPSIKVILDFGRYTIGPGGCQKILFGNKEYKEACSEFKQSGQDIQILDHIKGCTVISSGGKILTLYKH